MKCHIAALLVSQHPAPPAPTAYGVMGCVNVPPDVQKMAASHMGNEAIVGYLHVDEEKPAQAAYRRAMRFPWACPMFWPVCIFPCPGCVPFLCISSQINRGRRNHLMNAQHQILILTNRAVYNTKNAIRAHVFWAGFVILHRDIAALR